VKKEQRAIFFRISKSRGSSPAAAKGFAFKKRKVGWAGSIGFSCQLRDRGPDRKKLTPYKKKLKMPRAPASLKKEASKGRPQTAEGGQLIGTGGNRERRTERWETKCQKVGKRSRGTVDTPCRSSTQEGNLVRETRKIYAREEKRLIVSNERISGLRRA